MMSIEYKWTQELNISKFFIRSEQFGGSFADIPKWNELEAIFLI